MRERINMTVLRERCHGGFHDWSTQPWFFLQIRRLSIYLTWLLLHLPISANGVSLLAMLTGCVSGLLYAMNALASATICMALAVVLDFSDGEVSRYRQQSSKEGSYLDKVYHFALPGCVLAGMSLGAYRLHPNTWTVAAGLIGVLGVSMCGVVQYTRHIALWVHAQRLVHRAIDSGDASAYLSSFAGPRPGPEATPGAVRRLFLKILEWWNFPYYFAVLGLGALVQLSLDQAGMATRVTPIECMVFLSALSFPLLSTAVVLAVVRTRAIESGFMRFAALLSELSGGRE